MANDTNSGSIGDSQDRQPNTSDTQPAQQSQDNRPGWAKAIDSVANYKDQQDAPPNLDFGPPATGAGNTASSSQDAPPNLDFGPPATGASNTTDTTGTTIDVTDTGATAVEEPFVGSGGVGSSDYMDALRRGHEQAGGDYASDLGDTDDTQGGTGTA